MKKKLVVVTMVTSVLFSTFTYRVAHTKLDNSEEVSVLRSKVSRGASARDKLSQELLIYSIKINELQGEIERLQDHIVDLEEANNEVRILTSKRSMGTFQVTAYSPYDNVSGMESDGNPNKTATGTKPRKGTIAVDPKVIPYGSKIIIIYEDGTIERGIAEDCGGLIKGNIIDVFRQTYKETVVHGRKGATVLWYND